MKNKFQRRHDVKYLKDYNCPIVGSKAAGMPYMRGDGKIVFGEERKPKMNDNRLGHKKNTAPGSREHWNNLIMFDDLSNSITMSTEKDAESHRECMIEMLEKRKEVSESSVIAITHYARRQSVK